MTIILSRLAEVFLYYYHLLSFFLSSVLYFILSLVPTPWPKRVEEHRFIEHKEVCFKTCFRLPLPMHRFSSFSHQCTWKIRSSCLKKFFLGNENPLLGLTSKKEGKPFLLFSCSVCSLQLSLLSQFCIDWFVCVFADNFILPCPRLVQWLFLTIFRTVQAKLFLKLFTKTSKIFYLPTQSFFLSASHLFLTSSHQPSMKQQLLSLNFDICLCFSIMVVFLSWAWKSYTECSFF